MRSLISSAAILIFALSAQSASACWFHWGPTYTSAYRGYGYYPSYYSAAYAPAYYGGGYGCNSCCGSCSSCGSCGGCSTCSYTPSYGCPCGATCNGTCGASCGGGCSTCAGTVSSGKPVPDPISNRDSDADSRFNPPRTQDNGFDGSDGYDDSDPTDGFNAEGTSGDDGWGAGDPERPWGTGGDDFGANKPDTSGTGDHGANKPPMNTPVDEDAPAAPGDADDVLGPTGDGARAPVQNLRLATRFLRASHTELRSTARLAGTERNNHRLTTQLSSSTSSQSAPRWISLPMTEGRSRL